MRNRNFGGFAGRILRGCCLLTKRMLMSLRALLRRNSFWIRSRGKLQCSAHDSRESCLELMKKEARFIVLENVVAHSLFPLSEILFDSAEATAHELPEVAGGVYLGTPAKKREK
jgi:hypothetical protein